jgi:magnesium transporter
MRSPTPAVDEAREMATTGASAERALARVLLAERPGDAARVMETARDADSAALLEPESANVAAGVLRQLTPDRAARIAAALSPRTARGALTALDPSRAAALLERLDTDERERCLASLEPAAATELRELAAYPPDTAGTLMDPRVTSFRPDATVSDVVRRLRRFRTRRIQDVFLVGEDGELVGAVALQDIVLADPHARLSDLSPGVPISVRAVSSREEVCETFTTHRMNSLPVVDFDGRLLGVLRQREILQAAQEEVTGDAVRMVGASVEERALSSPWFAVRKRLPWLQVNLLTAFLAASVVGLFEGTIARVTALAVLLPVVAGQSGNTGAQALAVTMRGLALREIRARQWLPVVGKEVLAGAANGAAVAVTTAVAVYVWSGSTGLALVIGVSMVISMTLAGLAGAAIPLLLAMLRLDPAQSSSIILTTITDVVGFFSFLGIATLLAGSL